MSIHNPVGELDYEYVIKERDYMRIIKDSYNEVDTLV